MEKVVILIFVLIATSIIFLIFLKGERVEYRIYECEQDLLQKNSFSYDLLTKKLTLSLIINCCGIDLKVEKEGETYRIIERKVGDLCKCICARKIEIYNVTQKSQIIFERMDGTIETISPSLSFCGSSTYGNCLKDEDCVIDGCSGQICRSKFENPILTTCEWKDCYAAIKYGVKCKCLTQKCQWVRS
jgi:eight-cysteine-cluster-containing protein